VPRSSRRRSRPFRDVRGVFPSSSPGVAEPIVQGDERGCAGPSSSPWSAEATSGTAAAGRADATFDRRRTARPPAGSFVMSGRPRRPDSSPGPPRPLSPRAFHASDNCGCTGCQCVIPSSRTARPTRHPVRADQVGRPSALPSRGRRCPPGVQAPRRGEQTRWRGASSCPSRCRPRHRSSAGSAHSVSSSSASAARAARVRASPDGREGQMIAGEAQGVAVGLGRADRGPMAASASVGRAADRTLVGRAGRSPASMVPGADI
jgi:hypothetical protein